MPPWSDPTETDPTMEIRFFKPEGPYGFLSNYFPYRFTLECRQWESVEHFYQAAKFDHLPELAERIRELPCPDAAKSFARDRARLWRPDWESVRNLVMWKALQAKFGQSAFLTRELLLTGDARLCEASPFDPYWGLGPDGTGRNRLGRLLMRLRQQRSQEGESTAHESVSAA